MWRAQKITLEFFFAVNWVRITFNECLRQQLLSSELVIHKLSSLLIINGVNYHCVSQFYYFKMIFIVSLLLFFVNFMRDWKELSIFYLSFFSLPAVFYENIAIDGKYHDIAWKCDNLPIFTLSIISSAGVLFRVRENIWNTQRC